MMRSIFLSAVLPLVAGCASEVAPPPADYGRSVGSNGAMQSVAARTAAAIEGARADFASAAPETVFFDFNSAALNPAARNALDAQAAWLGAYPEFQVAITGHADLVGGEAYNDGIGMARARATARHLIRRGVARDRILMTESRGEHDPVVRSEAPERLNRRTVTSIAGYAADFGEMDGKRARLGYQRYSTDQVEEAEKPTTTASGTE